MSTLWLVILVVVGIYVLLSLKVLKQYENAVVFLLGRYYKTKTAGLRLIFPIFMTFVRVDMRLLTIDIPKQQMMTKDNVPLTINGVIYFRVENASIAIIKVQDYEYAITNFAETALRDVIGSMPLDSVLAEREEIGDTIRAIVVKETKGWGLTVEHIKLQDVEVPDDLKRLMSRQAAAEREKRATVIKAEGDRMAAENLSKAAATMFKSPGAMQLRTLQTIDGLGPTASNTVVLAVQVELMDAIASIKKK
jgi:regulator of protease activity HflC (stomatin/prohibitin superfamily)